MELKSKVSVVPKQKHYGQITLNSKDTPDVKKFKIGDEIDLIVKVKIKHLRQPDNWEISEEKFNPKDVLAGADIIKIEHKSTINT